jgi:hypothetical protein
MFDFGRRKMLMEKKKQINKKNKNLTIANNLKHVYLIFFLAFDAHKMLVK